jgi:diguanylate cyclase (GGDEF)-like protein/PAS domain S-box-containing protein
MCCGVKSWSDKLQQSWPKWPSLTTMELMIRFGENVPGWGGLRVLVAVLVLLAGACNAFAQEDTTINITPETVLLELSDKGTRVGAQRRNLQLEVPGVKDGTRAVLELRGQGIGPEFNWRVYTLRNAGPERRELVLSIDVQRLAASGIVNLEPFGSQLNSVQWVQTAEPPVLQNSATSNAYRFVLEPSESITVGLEGAVVLTGARLYDLQSFSQRESSSAFLRGAVLALATLLAFGILALYGIRADRVTVIGGLFGFATLLFIALEGGYLQNITDRFAGQGLSLDKIRAVVESLFALGVGACFWGLTNLKRRSFRAELPFLLLIVGLLALVAFAFIDPVYATKVARYAVLALTIAGFLTTLSARNRGVEIMANAILFWSVLLAWVFFAVVIVVGDSHSPVLHAAALSGLTAVLGVLAFAAVRLTFAQGFLSKAYMTDATRRSLALTGAEHFLWDWQPQENLLDVGMEIRRSLGHADTKAGGRDALRWFAALIHPADEMAYRKALDVSDLNAGDFIEEELRLRDADGSYHWFSLRARALPGAGGAPVRLIGTLTDITRNKQTEDRLINESIQDPVTGLPSRALFLDRVEREVSKPMTLPRRILMIGIERFKILNDGLGHDLGDQLLLAAGQRIAEVLKAEESVARISGSKFAVTHIEAIDGRTDEELAQDILASLAEPIKVLSQDIYLAACIGISLSSAQGFSAAELQAQAERALHEAQAAGPRSVAIYHDAIDDTRAENVALEGDLRRAIERREIEVYYQPIINLMTRDVAGLEALARWRHPARGLLQPSEFIGLAEESGMINEVGDLVLTEALRQMGIWQRVLTRNRPVFLSINVSADQLSDTGFLDRLSVLIGREGILPYSIKIEITESVVMRFPERAKQMIQRLRALGVGVACDDFGTGFSNLASLRDLNFDTLKMDRSFIVGGGLQGRGSVILQSVISMAHSLGTTVVAEGIESEEQAQHLMLMGCELGQGYYLGAAMAARDVQTLLAVLPAFIQQPPPIVEDVPAVGAAPMAPRITVLETDVEPTYESEPEFLPSIFAAAFEPKKKAKPKTKKPARKTSKTKAKKRRS